MDLSLFSPLTHALAVVVLLAAIAALVTLWSRASQTAGYHGRLRPALVWATTLPIGAMVVLLALFLLLSAAFALMFARP
jgi:hypothetical protein